MGMQIPCDMVPEVSIQDTERGVGKIIKNQHMATLCMEANRDTGRECPRRPYTSGDRISSERFSGRSDRISEGKKCDNTEQPK